MKQLQILGRKHSMAQTRHINISLITQRALAILVVCHEKYSDQISWLPVLMLETTVPHFNLKVTKKQLKRKLGGIWP